MWPMAKQKEAPKTSRATKVVGASLEPGDLARLDAFGERMRTENGLRPKRGTLAAMLVRRGLDVVEAEVAPS